MLKKSSPGQLALSKLILWTAIVTFIVFLLTFGIVGLRVIVGHAGSIYEGRWYAGIMDWLLPIGFILDILVAVVLMIRFTVRKLGGTNKDTPTNIES